MNNRIEKIRNFATERDRKIEDAKVARDNHINAMLATVKSFAPRMEELMTIATELCLNNIPLGKDGGYLELSSENVSNAWSHKTGFIVIGNRLLGFGIVGGGVCGRNLMFNRAGMPSALSCSGRYPGVDGEPFDDEDVRHLERFVREFDAFEKRFYDYVDNL